MAFTVELQLYFRKGRVLVSLSTMGWVDKVQSDSEGRMLALKKIISLAQLVEERIPVGK